MWVKFDVSFSKRMITCLSQYSLSADALSPDVLRLKKLDQCITAFSWTCSGRKPDLPGLAKNVQIVDFVSVSCLSGSSATSLICQSEYWSAKGKDDTDIMPSHRLSLSHRVLSKSVFNSLYAMVQVMCPRPISQWLARLFVLSLASHVSD